MIKKSVVVTFQFEGIHSWPDCPIEEVSFLRYPHRHMFHVELAKEVSHNDRETEIIMLKRKLEQEFYNKINLGSQSCEDIAESLIKKHNLLYCKVLEDGENGAYLWNT